MIDVNIDASEVQRLAAAIAAAGPKAREGTSTALSEVGGELRDSSRADAPRRTSALADSITMTGGNGWRRVSTGVRYAPFVEWGTYKDPPQPYMMPNAARAWAQLAGLVEKVGEEALDL